MYANPSTSRRARRAARRASYLSNPGIPADALPVTSSVVPPMGAAVYVYAPNGATPGAAAWRVSNGLSTPVTITDVFNDQSGVYVRVSANVATLLGPSQTGGFGEALAPYSQGSSVRTSAGAPVRSANPDDCAVVYYGGQAYICCGPAAQCVPLPILSPKDIDLLLAELPIGQRRRLRELSRSARAAVERAAAYAQLNEYAGRMPNQAHHTKTGPRLAAPDRRSNPTCFIDVAALRLHCPGSALHGVEVTDIEEIEGGGSAEGELVTASYVDPATGVETIGTFVVMADQGVPWWEHDGHCCESCALGEGCSDCGDEAA